MHERVSVLDTLQHGSMEVLGRHPFASNAAFIVEVGGLRAIYKPQAGERELWDFPVGTLSRREVAAYEIADALGVHCIPETVWRDEAPFGAGSVQRWIEPARIDDVDVVPVVADGWLAVLDAQLEDGSDVQVVHRDHLELRHLALLDALLNNGDRKGGHILRDDAGVMWAVDHGVTLHVEPKLRTVLWGFIGEPLPTELHARLLESWQALPAVRAALSDSELAALEMRAMRLHSSGVFPPPPPDWPAIPWPVF